MKAIVYTKFGPPEVLQLKELEKPRPKEDEVLIRIFATTVELEDPGFRKSPGFNGILRPRNPILGMELAGEIEAIGKDVSQFQSGDQVYGNAGTGLGTYAEYICLSEGAALAIKPANLTFEEAAALTNGALTALPFLREKGNIQKGQKVIINGASGTVGSAAVQIAKYYGAEVTGVCSTSSLELVKSLGADQVIDYTAEDIAEVADTFDILFDVAGKSTFARTKHLLRPGGIFLATVPSPAIMYSSITTSLFGEKKVRFGAMGLRSPDKKAKDLRFLAEMIEAGKLKPVIDKTYPLEQMAAAHRYVEEGKKKGTIAITVYKGE
jgi:NADPH:quinone reductase-like Zn-dependent oxidoreductase